MKCLGAKPRGVIPDGGTKMKKILTLAATACLSTAVGKAAINVEKLSQTLLIRDGVFYPASVLETQVYYDGRFINPIPVTPDSPFLNGEGPPSEEEWAWMLTTGIETNDPTTIGYLVSTTPSIMADAVKGKAYVDALNKQVDPATNSGGMPAEEAQDRLREAFDGFLNLPNESRYEQDFSKTDISNWNLHDEDLDKTGIKGSQLNTVIVQDFSGTKFGTLDVSDWRPTGDISGADLSKTNVRGDQLNNVEYMNGTNVSGRNMAGLLTWSGRAFLGTNFTDCQNLGDLSRCDINGATVKGQNLENYKPDNMYLYQTKFQGSTGLTGENLNRASGVAACNLSNLKGLSGFVASGKDIRGTDFTNTDVTLSGIVTLKGDWQTAYAGVKLTGTGITREALAQALTEYTDGELSYSALYESLKDTTF